MQLRIETNLYLLTFVFILLSGWAGCKQKTADQYLDSIPNNDQQSHIHPDRLHPSHHTAYTKVPTAPEGDTFFKTIQFPTTPPHRPDGHYLNPPKNPFEIPDYVKKYPDHFKIDNNGFWHVEFPPEKAQKLEAFDGWNLTDEEYDKQIAEIVSVGLDTFTAAIVIAHLPGTNNRTNKLYAQAYEESPDDLYTGLTYCNRLERLGELKEAEKVLRRLVKMYPDSTKALYRLADFISTKADSLDAHRREAIPYFEKLYRENPYWFVPIYKLGIIYYGLGEYEKALAYFQAIENVSFLMQNTKRVFCHKLSVCVLKNHYNNNRIIRQ